jgi:hypothetical protein
MRYLRWFICLGAFVAACRAASETSPAAPPAVSEVGRIHAKGIDEASGLVASRAHPGVFWTHNDGDDGVLYAIRADGSLVGKCKVNAKFKDWEDIASDTDGRLYLADVGNNSRERKSLEVYRIDEPDPAGSGKSKSPIRGNSNSAPPRRSTARACSSTTAMVT